MIQRLKDIWDDFVGQPYERRVLFGFATFRAVFTGAAGSAVWAYVSPWAMPAASVLAAIVSADFLEHYSMKLFFGYTYNPNVRAQGEWEGWTGYLHREFKEVWEKMKFMPIRPWDGQPGSGQFGSE